MPNARVVSLLTALVVLLLLFQDATSANLIDTAWTRRYDSPPSGNNPRYDIPGHLRLDGSGNVYVTGYSYVGGSADRAVLIKYAPDGSLLWTNTYTGPGGRFESIGQLELDGNGFPHRYGFSDGGEQASSDILVIKYTPEGDTLWVRRFDGAREDTLHGYDYPASLRIDGSGNVYVAGNSGFLVLEVGEIVILKYDASGNPLWTRTWPPVPAIDGTSYGANGADLDSAGNLYVAGTSQLGSAYHAILLKYNPDGDLVWQRVLGCVSVNPQPYVCKVKGNSMYFAGQSDCGIGPGISTQLIVRYSTDGDSLWARILPYDGGTGYAYDLEIEGAGNVYVNGIAYTGLGSKFATAKLDPDGNVLWQRLFDGGFPAEYHHSRDLQMDASGNLYTSGGIRTGASTRAFGIVKYSPDGDTLLTLLHDGGAACADNIAYAVGIDARGSVYLAGPSRVCGSNTDFFTIKYSARCDCFADPTCDGLISDVVDVVGTIGVAFRDVPPEVAGECNRDRTDVDCTGSTDIVDVVKVVGVAFRGADPMIEYCDPGAL